MPAQDVIRLMGLDKDRSAAAGFAMHAHFLCTCACLERRLEWAGSQSLKLCAKHLARCCAGHKACSSCGTWFWRC